jgi:Histidyl-tRNA synthetase
MLTQPPKGFRDFLPEKAIARNFVIEKIKVLFERFGFDPLETPALEYREVLLGKYGEEADKLIYLFEDRGGRKLGLRYDQTVPLARVVAQYQNITKPFKRYQIQPVWRAENPQSGRFREFIQADIDIVGSEDLLVEAEIITCALAVFRELGFKKTKMLINDRQSFTNFNKKIIIAIDKLEKIGEEKVIAEIEKKMGLSSR